MAIVREPMPLPSDLSYVPAEGTPRRVATGDSWYSLAERPEVRATGMTANDLCYFNFKTRKPPEINWYLHHKVGCRKTTRDGLNFTFSSADRPGIVYLPRVGAPQSVDAYPPRRRATGRMPGSASGSRPGPRSWWWVSRRSRAMSPPSMIWGRVWPSVARSTALVPGSERAPEGASSSSRGSPALPS